MTIIDYCFLILTFIPSIMLFIHEEIMNFQSAILNDEKYLIGCNDKIPFFANINRPFMKIKISRPSLKETIFSLPFEPKIGYLIANANNISEIGKIKEIEILEIIDSKVTRIKKKLRLLR